MANVFSELGENLKDVGEKIGEGAKTAAETVANGAKNVASATVNGVKKAGHTVAEKTGDVVENIKEHAHHEDRDKE